MKLERDNTCFITSTHMHIQPIFSFSRSLLVQFKFTYYIFTTIFYSSKIFDLSYSYSSINVVWRISKSILIAYKKMKLIETNAIKKSYY